MARTLPTAEQLWTTFAYSPLTGELFWRTPKQGRSLSKPAGTFDNGYRKVSLDGAPYLAHRLVWCWVSGIDPKDLHIDHIDRNRGDNRWWNLRLATQELNAVNRPGKGYYLRRDTNRAKPWCASVYIARGKSAVKHFATEDEARSFVAEKREERVRHLSKF